MSWCMVHNDSYRDLTYKDSTHQEKQEDLPHTLHTLSHLNEWYLWHSRAVTHNPSQTSCRPSHLTSLPIPLAQLSQLNKSRWCSGSWGPMGCLGSCQQRPCTIKMWHCTVYVLSTLFEYGSAFGHRFFIHSLADIICQVRFFMLFSSFCTTLYK